jgi:glycine oxidase
VVATQDRSGSPPAGAFEVAIAGGGVIGLACAWRLARAGRRVAVVDPEPGRGAAWVAAGMLAPANEAHFGEEELTHLLVAAASRWPRFADELEAAVGQPVDYEPSNTVVVAADPSDRAALDQLLTYRQSLGLQSQRLGGSDCRRLVPALSPAICGGAEVPGDHQVDNRKLVAALLEACRISGVAFVRERVGAVDLDAAGAVRGLSLAGGTRLSSPTVVAALGWQTGGLGGVPPGTLPEVRPVKGHVLRLRGTAPLIERTIRGFVRGRTCYLVPRRDHSVVVGATVEEMGEDLRVQAGSVHTLLDDARALLPGIDELELFECSVGLRPGSADNGPHVGWTAVPGLAVATGHFRNGVLLTPITAEAIAALADGGGVAPELAGFGAGPRSGVAERGPRR